MNDYIEIWYSLQESITGANDWHETSTTRTTLEGAQQQLSHLRAYDYGFEYRIAKHILIEEVMPG